ncbi:MAG: cation diffusion facilitator family transporter [Oscillospiraceae bacterium]
MTNLLVKRFVKDSENVTYAKVRESYGKLSSGVGIACNILLFVLKYTVGTLSHSISVISDAFNNLSDCASCIVTLFGYKMASKPADKDHPFGHGRMEYLTSLTIAVVIIVMGVELLKNSAAKIISPSATNFSLPILISLIFSVGVKLWMSLFNSKLGKKINSTIMLATAKDSRSDMLATSAAAVGLIASAFTPLPLDGIMGAAVSVLIILGGFGIVKDTVDLLLGQPADSELIGQIKECVCSREKIIGIHDLIIHDYGPGNKIGSCHVEVRSDEDFLKIHDAVDLIEREIYEQLKVRMTIHMDPVEVDNERINLCRAKIETILKLLDERLTTHDFRMVAGETHTNVIFDIVVPFDCQFTNEQLKERIDSELEKESTDYYTVITFDKDYS